MNKDFRDQYPDTLTLAKDELSKMDELLKKIDDWKDDRFADQFLSFERKFDGDAKNALIIRALESNGMKVGLPDNEVLNAMFTLIEDTVMITLDLIATEEIRI